MREGATSTSFRDCLGLWVTSASQRNNLHSSQEICPCLHLTIASGEISVNGWKFPSIGRRKAASLALAALVGSLAFAVPTAPASAAPLVTPAAVTATGDDGLALSSTPDSQIKGSSAGFTLTISDSNLSNVTFDSYQISGLPEGWTLKASGNTLNPVSPSPSSTRCRDPRRH